MGYFWFMGQPQVGSAEGQPGCDALGVSELLLLPVEFHALGTEQHKVQTGVLNPHLRETSHVGVGSPVMLFHKKKKNEVANNIA